LLHKQRRPATLESSWLKRLRFILIAIPILLGLLGTTSSSSLALAQQEESHAGLVLQFPDGTTQTYCIPFTGDSISGLDMLLKTGLNVKVEAYGGLGAEICQIGATGCDYPNQPCACQSFGPGGVYWSYHHLSGGQWRASALGAGSYRVHNGDVEGWAWSDGKPPKLYIFAQLCHATQPQPEPSAIPPTNTHASPTPRPAPPTTTRKPAFTVTPRPAPSTRQPQPTAEPVTPTPTTTPQLTSTTTAHPTATPPPQPSTTPTDTPSPTQPAPLPTPTIRNPQSAIRNPEDVARTVGLAIAGIVAGSLAVWGITAATRRGRKGGGTNVE
jgi:hypothetical protein